jgi:hypothetical protein
MGTGAAVPHDSRVAFGWSDDHLYVAFDLVDPQREAKATENGTHVYLFDTDAEILIAGSRGYYEVGTNSIGVRYEVGWTWLEPLVVSGDMAGLDRAFRLPNYLYYAPQNGHQLGRIGDLDFTLDGLELATQWNNDHGLAGWSVAMALPWEPLSKVTGLPDAPRRGLEFRIQAYRAQHVDASEDERRAFEESWGEGASPFDGWTWSTQGNGNVHNLDRWACVRLV